MMRPAASSGETAKSAFLPTKESRRRGLVHSFTGDGVAGVLELLAGEGVAKEDEPQVGILSQLLAKMSRVLLAAWRLTSSLHGSFNPHLLMSFQEMISEFSPTVDWQSSPVRCLAWHPHTAKLCVALQDDSIHVHSSQQLVKPVLKHAGQRAVNCMAWKPCGASELAVGCQAGVLLWHVDPASVVARPSTSCVTKLFRAGHTPVTGVCWDPHGKLLVSCSPADTSMLVWSPASEVATPLRRVGGGGVSLVKWSPEGSKLFQATPGRTFRGGPARTGAPSAGQLAEREAACVPPRGLPGGTTSCSPRRTRACCTPCASPRGPGTPQSLSWTSPVSRLMTSNRRSQPEV